MDINFYLKVIIYINFNVILCLFFLMYSYLILMWKVYNYLILFCFLIFVYIFNGKIIIYNLCFFWCYNNRGLYGVDLGYSFKY